MGGEERRVPACRLAKIKEDGKLREVGVLVLATFLIWERVARVKEEGRA